jgi:hypothetical protein
MRAQEENKGNYHVFIKMEEEFLVLLRVKRVNQLGLVTVSHLAITRRQWCWRW